MADTGEKKYSLNEALNRILRVLIGQVAPDDAPGTLSGSVLSIDAALSKLAEVMEGNDPEETFNLPAATVIDQLEVEDIEVNDTVTANVVDTNTLYGKTSTFGDEDVGNTVSINSAGEVHLDGAATVWDDLRFPALALRAPAAGAAAEPDLVQMRDNGAGSTGVFSYAFDPDTEEELYFAAQLPHSWAGTPISLHTHWTILENATGTVAWGCEWTWINITGTFPTTSFGYGNVNLPNEDNLIAYRHYLTPIATITGTFGTNTVSSMLVGRIFRDATESGAADSCASDAVLLEVDFHYEQDQLGSNDEYAR